MAKDCPAPRRDGNINGVQEGNQGNNSLINNGNPFFINYKNIHARPVYEYVSQHPGSNCGEIQNALGFTRGRVGTWKDRIEIYHVCEVLTFFRYFRKVYHRYYPTDKIPLQSPRSSPRPERTFDSNGMPRVQPTRTATMPQCFHLEPSGGEGE